MTAGSCLPLEAADGTLLTKCTHPIPLEAVLRAEIAVLHPQLEACRTLQAARVVVAVVAHALADSHGLGTHIDRKEERVGGRIWTEQGCSRRWSGREAVEVDGC